MKEHSLILILSLPSIDRKAALLSHILITVRSISLYSKKQRIFIIQFILTREVGSLLNTIENPSNELLNISAKIIRNWSNAANTNHKYCFVEKIVWANLTKYS